jgi:serine/threonine protein kinase
MSASREPTVPERIGRRYRVLGVLGEGSSGTVVSALDEDTNQRVAIKLLRAGLASVPESRAAFEREAATVNELGLDDAVVPILDTGEVDGIPYHVMPLMVAGGLNQLADSGSLTTRRLLPLLEQLATAVDALHANGIVHGDIKPANILLSDDEPSKVRLIDFGLSRPLGEPLSRWVGTPAYAPPEQLLHREPLTPAADIYSLAAIIYYCLAGEPPLLRGTRAETEMAKLFEPAPALSGPIGGPVNDVLQAGLSREPNARPQSASALVDALEGRLSTLSPALLDRPLPVNADRGELLTRTE